MKLQKKFILIFISISMIPIIIFSLYTYSRYTSLVKRQTLQTAENLLNVAAAQTDYTLKSVSQIMEAMYLTKEDGFSMVDDLKQYLGQDVYTPSDLYKSNEKLKFTCQDFVYFNNHINGIYIFTPDGPVLGYGYGNSCNITSDYHPADDVWYQKILELKGGTYIYGPSKKDFIEGSSVSVSFCNALYDVYTREFLGVLFIDCEPGIFDLSNVNSLPETASLTVNNGSVPLYVTSPVSGNNTTDDTMHLERELSFQGLTLNIEVSQSSLSREFGITQNTLIALSVTCIAGILILSVFLSRSIITPIIYLSSQMQVRDRKQDVSDSPYYRYGDEIGTLYTSYQEMLDEREYYIKHELENKLIVLDSQMRALESQINAHFLYNTLEAINSIAVIEKVKSISVMALALGSMFRYSIKTQSELVPLSAELKNVQDYTAIQQIRFDNAFSLTLDIPTEYLERKVLKLILQPLVENALYHGLSNCMTGGVITLRAQAQGSDMILDIIDNGEGISSDKLAHIQENLQEKAEFTELGKRRHTSIGIRNINTRIALYYGEAYGLRIFSKEGAGTRVQITLPIID